MSAYFVHILCIFAAYLCIFVAHVCIFDAYFLHIKCIFVHMLVYFLHISCICPAIYAYLLHIIAYSSMFLYIYCICPPGSHPAVSPPVPRPSPAWHDNDSACAPSPAPTIPPKQTHHSSTLIHSRTTTAADSFKFSLPHSPHPTQQARLSTPKQAACWLMLGLHLCPLCLPSSSGVPAFSHTA